MSIYGTSFTFHLEDDDDRLVEIYVQVVPAWVTFEAPYLCPPRLGIDENEGYAHPRMAVFVAPWTTKGGEGHGGQEYVNPLLVLAGEEYEKMPFREVIQRLDEAVRSHAATERATT